MERYLYFVDQGHSVLQLLVEVTVFYVFKIIFTTVLGDCDMLYYIHESAISHRFIPILNWPKAVSWFYSKECSLDKLFCSFWTDQMYFILGEISIKLWRHNQLCFWFTDQMLTVGWEHAPYLVAIEQCRQKYYRSLRIKS